jgi:hypothetical protein
MKPKLYGMIVRRYSTPIPYCTVRTLEPRFSRYCEDSKSLIHRHSARSELLIMAGESYSISSNPIQFISRSSARDTNNHVIFNSLSGTLRLNKLLRLFQNHCLELGIFIYRPSAKTDLLMYLSP